VSRNRFKVVIIGGIAAEVVASNARSERPWWFS